MGRYLLESDRDSLLQGLASISKELTNSKVFITGGTGFFGKWILNSIKLMNSEFQANIKATILSRNPVNFLSTFTHLEGDRNFEFLGGDLCDFVYPAGHFDYVIHAASIVHSPGSIKEPLNTIKSIVDGTRNILEFAKQKSVKALLLTSSGAVYGKQPSDLERIDESYLGGPDFTDSSQAYHEGKRLAELLAVSYWSEFGLNTKIARCFAFIGPHLPLDGHFAAGNFIRDVLQGKAIKINGDGTPVRSYMYPTDLVIWLWTILLEGKSARPYNVGSPIPVNLLDLAQSIQREFKSFGRDERSTDVFVSKKPETGMPATRYVPCIKRPNLDLNLEVKITLEEGLRRTFEWYQGESSLIGSSSSG